MDVVYIWTYAPIANLPEHVVMRSAEELISFGVFLELFEKNRYIQQLVDALRLKGVRKGVHPHSQPGSLHN